MTVVNRSSETSLSNHPIRLKTLIIAKLKMAFRATVLTALLLLLGQAGSKSAAEEPVSSKKTASPAAQAPVASPAPAASGKQAGQPANTGEPKTATGQPAAITNAPPPTIYEQQKKAGLIPGTPEFEQKKAELKKKEEADAKAFDELEAVWLKKIEDDLIAIERYVVEQKPDIFSLKEIGKDPHNRSEGDQFGYVYGLRLSEVATYLELTQDPPAARPAAMEFLQAYVAVQTNQTHHLLKNKSLTDYADAASKAGSNDPLVKLHLMMVKSSEGVVASNADLVYARVMFENLIPIFERDKRYPRAFALQTHLFASDCAKRSHSPLHPLTTPNVLSSWMEWFIEMGTDRRSLSLAYARTKFVMQDLELAQQKQLFEATMKHPGIDPWLVHMIGGIYHTKLGWKYRGGGFAGTVTKDGWAKLHEHLELARQHLLRAYWLQPKLPEAACSMMPVVLHGGTGTGTSTEWFLRTVKICFDYREVYEHYEWSLRPRWGGSIPELLALAKACLDTERFDTLVPTMGLDLLLKAQTSELGASSSIFTDPGVLPALNQFAEALDNAVTLNPGKRPLLADGDYYRSRLGALLTRGGNLAGAHKVLLPTADSIDSGPYSSLFIPSQYYIGLGLSASPELLDDVKQIDDTIQKGADAKSKPTDFDPAFGALKNLHRKLRIPDNFDSVQLKKLRESADASKSKQASHIWMCSFLLNSETTLNRLRRYSADNWVKLTVDDQLSGWEVSSSKTKPLPPDGVELTADGDVKTYSIQSLARFVPPYDILVSMETANAGVSGDIPWTGISLGATDLYAISPSEMRLFGVVPKAHKAAVLRSSRESNPEIFDVPGDGPHTVRVKMWDNGHYQFVVNDLRIADRIDARFNPASVLAFGATIPTTANGTARLNWMQIRRLTQSPPSDRTDQSAIQAYAQYELSHDKNDAMAHFDLGRSLFHQGKYDEALKSLDAAAELQPAIGRLGYRVLKATSHLKLGQYAAAMEQYQKVRLSAFKPDDDVASSEMKYEYARLLTSVPDAKLRNGKVALLLARDLTRNSETKTWRNLWVLASAHAECGDFPAASKSIEESLALAPDDQKDFLKELQKLFDSRKPYRLTK